MSKPRVFHSKTRTLSPWGLRYRSSETTDWFPTWRDAVDRALVWARVSHVTSHEAAMLTLRRVQDRAMNAGEVS